MSLRTKLMAAFCVPIGLLLATVGVVSLQQRATAQLLEAVEARELILTVEELTRELLAHSAVEENTGEALIYWQEADRVLLQAEKKLPALGTAPELMKRLEVARDVADAAVRGHGSDPKELYLLILEDGLGELVEVLSIMSVDLRNRQVLAMKREEGLRNLPVRFGVAMGLVAVVGAGVFAAWFAGRISKPLLELSSAAARIADGDLGYEIEAAGIPEIDHLAESFRSMQNNLASMLGRIREGRRSLASAARTIRESVSISETQSEEQRAGVEKATRSVEQMIASVGSVATGAFQLAEDAQASSSSTGTMELAANDTRDGVERLHEEIERTASAVGQLQASMASVEHESKSLGEAASATMSSVSRIQLTVAEIESSASESSELARRANRVATEGLGAMRSAADGMSSIEGAFSRIDSSVGDLSVTSRSIREIIEVIDDIAGKSQMLSLNAAIIAAQAGDQGKAFGVVANEVSALADQSAKAVRGVEALIVKISRGIETSVRAAQDGASQIGVGASLVGQASECIEEMAQQAQATEVRAQEIVRAVSESRAEVDTVASEAARTAAAVAEVDRAMTEQGTTGLEMLTSIERIRDLGLEARSTAESQRAESLRVSEISTGVADRAEEIRTETARQRVQADEIGSSLVLFRESAAGWQEQFELLAHQVETLLNDSDELGELVGDRAVAHQFPAESSN